MHILKQFATFLRIKIHHHQDYIQKTLQRSQFANLAEFIFIYEIGFTAMRQC